MVELVVTVIALTVAFSVSLWIIHKQALHVRDMQTTFLLRQSFNFEKQWKLWLQDRKATGETIGNLAGWNARLCDSHEKMGQLLQQMVGEVETRLSHLIAQKLEHGLAKLLSAVEKSSDAA